MKLIQKGILLLFKDPKAFLAGINKYGVYNWMPDKLFLKFFYKLKVGRSLNLSNPTLFNEKLQWLKLYDRRPEYINLVDKYEVRSHVRSKIGEKYLIPLLGIWDNFSEICFDELPNQFVLKCTHDSGSFFICKDKNEIDIDMLRRKYQWHMRRNLFWHGREWPYKNVAPRILCEELLEDDILDYKFYCFNGSPKFFYISQGDNTKGTLKMSFYDMDWNKCPFYRADHEPLDYEPTPPENFDNMIEIVKILCAGYPFIRVDLFNVKGRIYFSELTLFPGSGFTPFLPQEYERLIGDLLTLPQNS